MQDVITVTHGEELKVCCVCLACVPFKSGSVHVVLSPFRVHHRLLVLNVAWVQGNLTCAPNAKNHRDLDITIGFDFKGSLSSLETSQTYRLR
jgi:hypothetical protein